MEMNDTLYYNCSLRYELGQPGVDPVSINVRYPTYILLERFMPGTLLVIRIFMITWFTVGLFGNSMSFIIWISKPQRRKNTSAIYLSALSLTDFFLILFLINYHVVRYWGLNGIANHAGMCEIYQSLSIFSQYYSTILVFGFTLERYLAVCFPFKRHKLCTAKRAVLAVMILAVICLIPTIYQSVLWNFNGKECELKSQWIQDAIVQGVLTGLEILFSLLIPLAALVFNILLLKEMRRLIRSTAMPAVKQQQNSSADKLTAKGRKGSTFSAQSETSTNPQSKSRESSGFLATTIMLVILSFYLIACAVPPGAFYLAQFNWDQPDMCLNDEAIDQDAGWNLMFRRLQAKELVDVLCASHYALNFFIYVFTSKKFRMQAFWILTCNKEQLKRLTKPSATETWMFPRRTAPRKMRNMTKATNEEHRTLINDVDATDGKQNPGNGDRFSPEA